LNKIINKIIRHLKAVANSATDKQDTIQLISNNEIDRLNKMPRFLSSYTELFGKQINFVDASTYLGSLFEIFNAEIYKFQDNNNSSNITIIDCGANIGLATIYFKKHFSEAQVICYEADPMIFEVLQRNLISFGLTDVLAVNAAVSNREGNINFHMEGGHSGMITNDAVSEKIVSVKSIKLKNVLAEMEEVTFLKIDIEGHETSVIPDIADELKKVKFLFLEYHSFIDNEQQLDALLSIVSKAGFRYYIKESANKKFPFIDKELFLKMDLLINIFCYRD
jgi:FkbM family methyltransferase